MALTGNNSLGEKRSALHGPRPLGWFSGNIALIMVFLNGLILTFTAYATLNIFISQIVDEGATSVAFETREHMKEKFSNLEKGIQMAASSVYFSGKLDPDDITKNFKNAFSYQGNFNDVFWLERQENGPYIAHRMLNDSKGPANEEILDLHKKVIEDLNKTQDSLLLISAANLRGGENNYPLILARKVKLASGHEDIVYGISQINQVVADEFFNRRQNILSLSIRLGPKNYLYAYQRHHEKEPHPDHIYTSSANVPLADKALDVKVGVSLSEREVFLKKIPLLMFLFGATLTLIGTLYVRNNQKQALRLASMNAELAQNNNKLNTEILEREKLNHTLRKQERENHALIDAVSDIIFETSTDGDILFLNETWQKITGFSPERSLGRNLFDLLYMPDQAEQKSNMAQLVKGKKQAYRAFTRLRTSDGTFRSVELAVSMLRQDENKDLRVVGTITDVEERRRTERALSEAEKKYRAIVENAASGIYQVTPEGVYLSANPAMAKILGFGMPEDILRDVRNANTDIYYNARERERSLRDAVRGESVNVECQVRQKGGKIIWVQENLRAVKDDEEQLLFFEGSMEDITQRKDAEIALREAKVGSDLASRAKSEFLANMSHELRTPLNAIIGFSDIIGSQSFGPVGRPEYLEYARDINESGKRLLQAINDILDVSRIDAGERQLNEGVVDVQKLVVSGLEMLAPKIDANKIVISNFVNNRTPKLIGEAHAIKQMIMNLVSNAVKFTPEGGRVSIHADIDDYGQMHVSITDTGIGLTDEEIEIALSPFGQINGSMSKSTSGTGLGLTLVKSLMILHGGMLEIFSQKGIGTTATLIFPAKRVSMPDVRQPVDA